MFLNGGIALRITIDRNCSFFLIFIIFIFHIIIYQVKNQLFHIQVLFLLESENTLMVEKKCQRTHCTQVSAEFVENGTHVRYGTGRVVGKCIYEYSYSVRAVSLIRHALIVTLVFTHRILDGTLDVILRHVFTLTSSDHRTECRVVFGFRTTCLYSNSDLFTQSCKCFSHVPPSFQLCGFSIFKCSSHWFIFLD